MHTVRRRIFIGFLWLAVKDLLCDFIARCPETGFSDTLLMDAEVFEGNESGARSVGFIPAKAAFPRNPLSSGPRHTFRVCIAGDEAADKFILGLKRRIAKKRSLNWNEARACL
jgi:hypothetical protein